MLPNPLFEFSVGSLGDFWGPLGELRGPLVFWGEDFYGPRETFAVLVDTFQETTPDGHPSRY